MNILNIICSSRGQASESARLAKILVAQLLELHPTAQVNTRIVGGNLLGHVDGSYATSQQSTEDVSRDGTAATSKILIQELEQADILVIGTPMHNYTVPSALKAWIDHVARVRNTFTVGPNGKVGLLHDRPVLIAVSSGGKFSGDRARQPDFLTPYLRTILSMIGLQDVTFFTVEGTAMGPATLNESRAKADQALLKYFTAARV